MRGKWALVAVAALVAGMIAGAVSLLRESNKQAEVAPPAKKKIDRPVAAEVSLPGVLAAQNVVSIPAPIEGTLGMVMVEVGDEVYQNMLLADIENTALQAEAQAARERVDTAQTRVHNLENAEVAARLEASRANADAARARSELEKAEKAARRQQMLYREGATPRLVFEKVWAEYEAKREQFEAIDQVARKAVERVDRVRRDLDEARQRLAEAEADLEGANQDLEATQIFSPVDGVVTGMSARQGEEVNPGMQSLFQIAVDLTHMEVAVEPSPADLARIYPGQTARIRVAEIPDEAIAGVVREINGGRVVVAFLNPSPDVRPGLTAQVTILTVPPSGAP